MSIDIAKVKQLREQMDLTQQQAAEKAGLVSKQRWNQIEAGRVKNITLETLEQVAKALGVKAKELLR